ncbi:Kv channel-interacting protein 1-like [Xenia sp. Carnegie-2017]|uniref:Kv channel-interacting protein 1-like n=1 Tax=Xenia sp. Carnegie-2017 TaxID=2897299 RepID=UPI001F04FBC7|nr:Kv channel-interacting protein 1-like [Xenia sp. Carnegie-2017]
MRKMGSKNSQPIQKASSVDGDVLNDDIKLPQSPTDNCMYSCCENNSNKHASSLGSVLKVIRGCKSRKENTDDDQTVEDGLTESSFNYFSEQTEGMEGLLLKTNFTRPELQRMYRGFKNDCPKGYADKEVFKKIYAQFFPHGDSTQYADLVFNAFDLDRRGKLSYETFILRLSIALHGTTEDKLKWMFHLYDVDGDGYISRHDLIVIVTAVHNLMGSSSISNESETIQEQVLRIFEILNKSDDGYVTVDGFIGNCKNDECINKSLAMFDLHKSNDS